MKTIKTLLIFALLALLASCLPATNRYKLDEKRLPEDQVNLYVSKIDSEFSTPGFKGLHLGMTHDDVNKLVENTYWAYKLRSGKNENEPDLRDEVWMGREQFTSPVDWDTIGCYGKEKRYCHWTSGILVNYVNNRVVSIEISGITLSADEIDRRVKNWGKFALEGLTEKYGKPTTTIKNIEDVNIFDFKTGFSRPIYLWDLGPNTIKLCIDQSRSEFGCSVLFENKEGVIKLKNIESQKKHSF